MSEELKPCPHCGNTPPLQVPTRLDGVQMELVACLHCGTRLYGMTRADAARVWNKRHDLNPWRYPEKGELPEDGTGVLATYLLPISPDESIPVVGDVLWMDGQWRRFGQFVVVRAWKDIGKPAPELEETE